VSKRDTFDFFGSEGSGKLECRREVAVAAVVAMENPDRDHLSERTAMQHEFREGDWVRHHSCPEPIQVIGTGTTIAVQFPNGAMQAFEPCELENVHIAKVPVPKVGLGSAERFAFVLAYLPVRS
jgi:hypothetical protein